MAATRVDHMAAEGLVAEGKGEKAPSRGLFVLRDNSST